MPAAGALKDILLTLRREGGTSSSVSGPDHLLTPSAGFVSFSRPDFSTLRRISYPGYIRGADRSYEGQILAQTWGAGRLLVCLDLQGFQILNQSLTYNNRKGHIS